VTEENRRRNIEDEIARADEAMRAAEALLSLRLFKDAVSRAYYAVFHAIRAVLLSRGIEPKTHAGAIHLLNVHLVRDGVLPASHNRLLAGLQRARELADYDAAVTFDADDAARYLSDARAFTTELTTLLEREGWRVARKP
jgi:uncharacterized protein (UPF0332 family)